MSESRKISFWPFWYLSLVMLAVSGAVMSLHPQYHFRDLLRLQFVPSLADFYEVVRASGQPVEILVNATHLDFIFLASYTAFFFFSFLAVAKRTSIRRSGALLALAMVPGILDTIENVVLLELLSNDSRELFRVFYLSAHLKWAIVIPWILVITVLVFYQVVIAIDKIYRKLEKPGA